MANNQISQKKEEKKQICANWNFEICSLMSAPMLLLKLPTCDANSFDNPQIHYIKFHVQENKNRLCSISFNLKSYADSVNKAPHQH